ncbi:MAG: hypothetical protein PHE55_05960 [Methylococcaceae bacterium]|nr:hypothetical protein [Methylococcaceae bacterium]
MAAKFMRGALVEFMPTFLIPLPNVIIFQFNPETMTHAWTQADTSTGSGPGQTNPVAVKGRPGESFSFTIAVDSNDMIADGSPIAEGIAKVSGVYSRLAALEMLLYPVGSFDTGLLGTVSASVSIGAGGISVGGSAGGSAAKASIPAAKLPVVLFVWGPGRIVPVRVTGLSITEKLYDGLLNPIHAEAQLSLRVLTPDELEALDNKDPLKDVAKVAYSYSQGLRQALAVANLANSVESIIGLLPV